MSKWYEVEVQVLIVCAVEVRDGASEVQAIEAAEYHAPRRGRVVCTAQPLPAEHLATIRKNADLVLPLGGVDYSQNPEDDDDE